MWGATDSGGPWRRRAGGGGGGGASATLRDEGVELLHDSEGAFDIFRYWVTGSEEQEWHFQAGLSRESHQKPKRIILFTQLASLGEGGVVWWSVCTALAQFMKCFRWAFWNGFIQSNLLLMFVPFKKKEMLQHKFPALKEEKFWIESDVKRRPG